MTSSFHEMKAIKEFLEEHVTRKFRFKVPDDEHPNEQYQLKLDYPKVAMMEWLDYPSAPQILIRPVIHSVNKDEGTFTDLINLMLVVWNPGTHGKEIYYPTDNCLEFETTDDPEIYISTNSGWRDAYALADMIEWALKAHRHIGDEYDIVEDDISVVPLKEEVAPEGMGKYYGIVIEFQLTGYYDKISYDCM